MKTVRTNSMNSDFQDLVAELNKDLAIRNGESNDIFAQLNNIHTLNHALVAYYDGQPVGCATIRQANFGN